MKGMESMGSLKDTLCVAYLFIIIISFVVVGHFVIF
jgi:hypothetical protein